MNCASCKQGEIENDDINDTRRFMVREPINGRLVCSGYLCDDHITMYLEDGYYVEEVKR